MSASNTQTKAELHNLVGRLTECQKLDEALKILQAAGKLIEMPLVAWTRDISSAQPDPIGMDFNQKAGWPIELNAPWIERGYTLKSWFAVRARFHHLPFAAMIGERLDPEIAPDRDDRVIQRAVSQMTNMTSGVVAPIHMPRARVATLTWLGRRPMSEAQEIARVYGPELLSLGHWLMTIEAAREEIPPSLEDLARLTQREWECLRLCAAGYSDKEIAQLTQTSPVTVRYHVDNVVHKLGASSRIHAVAIAAQLGLLGAISR